MLRQRVFIISVLLILFFMPGILPAQELKAIQLVKPQMDSGRLLMHVLKDRKSSREFSNRKLPIRVLSNLLWSACGVNRPDSGKRTVPSAKNWQEVDVYVATDKGLYLYDAKKHRLNPVLAMDVRALTGSQSYVKDAPIDLIYVADYGRMENAANDVKDLYSAVDTGFISQNVYLYCASEGLATVSRGTMDRAALGQVMKLRPEQRIILAQTVGYPKK
ncbi:MAG TPA: nitroreductase [Syntrophus sp. (in: bacteria)]|jgi:SagB-type dehydrogenase family enzyme|nr:nitroreductase [Syntrophus sp. (in: bacteria)]